ncbi:hypothetical protein Pfo_031600, partial [Paulownia fortunei]
VDESHVTMPQETLVNYGFRLPSALDNRPLTLPEFEQHVNQIIYMSATPGDYEMNRVTPEHNCTADYSPNWSARSRGIDVPEVSLVAILDADKEGFLRNPRSLIQTIGRAARNENGHVIMYADKTTASMAEAMQKLVDVVRYRDGI